MRACERCEKKTSKLWPFECYDADMKEQVLWICTKCWEYVQDCVRKCEPVLW